MPSATTPNLRSQSRLLFLYADGGALRDLNDRLRTEEERKRLNFLDLPDGVARRLKETDNLTAIPDYPKEGRFFFTLGATSAKSFVEEMSTAWTVITVPLGLCRYDRNSMIDPTEHNARESFKVRFHGPISFHLGFLAAQRFSREVTVVVISDDTQLLPAMADARRQGLDTRLVWPESAFPDDTRFFAGRNGVPTMLVHPEMLLSSPAASQPNHLSTLLKLGR